jgi:hypothetical protein
VRARGLGGRVVEEREDRLVLVVRRCGRVAAEAGDGLGHAQRVRGADRRPRVARGDDAGGQDDGAGAQTVDRRGRFVEGERRELGVGTQAGQRQPVLVLAGGQAQVGARGGGRQVGGRLQRAHDGRHEPPGPLVDDGRVGAQGDRHREHGLAAGPKATRTGSS